MGGLTLLAEARGAGLTVWAEGGRLRVRGPRRAAALARRFLAHRAAILAALALEAAFAMTGDGPPADWPLLWGERAAIREYDGGLPRERAEALALLDILRQMRRAGETDPVGNP